jgi:hypothetical protein
MRPETLFQIHLLAGYAAWLLCFGAFIRPWLNSLERDTALRAIAMLHGFRFFGLVFILPGVVGSGLPSGFATPTAWGDFATGVLALLAVASFRVRPLFRLLVAAFNVIGFGDLLLAYAHAVQLGLPDVAGQLGAAYAIPIIYVPLLAITHVAAFGLLARPARAHAASAGAA